MNAKMIETALGMIARFIPPEEYAKAVKAIAELTDVAQSIDARMKRIEEFAVKMDALQSKVDMLETVVRTNVDGGEAAYAARDLYMVPGTIEQALAPSKGGLPDVG